MPPKLGTSLGYGRLYWKYSEKDPKWKVLKTYDSNDGITFECKLTKEEKKMSKFEVGDTVKVVKLDYNWWSWVPQLAQYIGKTGKIKRPLNDCDEAIYTVDFNNDSWCFPKDWLELVEKSSKYWTGKVVCIQSEPYYKFEVGKVYEVKDGRFMGPSCTNQNVIEEQCCCVTGVDNLNERYGYGDPIKFVEFKGFADQE